MSVSTPRQRPFPVQSTPTGSPSPSDSPPPGSSSRRRPPTLAFSPLSHHAGSSIRSVSAQSVPSYQASVASSSFPNTSTSQYLSASRGSSIAPAPSRVGSTATTANPGSTRFRRGHVRNRPGQPNAPPAGVSSINPDLVDLMALEEPDVVFRMFGVRDVRKIEQRASEAANAKVAELRTMVGERYRDLLAAADSIVRMRGAADKLLDRLEGVETAIHTAGAAIEAEPPNRRPSITNAGLDSNAPRRLSSPPTLSLTLHLFLNLSSIVHSLIEQSKFLPAARFENLGRVVWRELEAFEPEESDTDDGVERVKGSVKEMFPIVIKHHESMGQLAPLIARRATAELRSVEASSLSSARTLASLILLDHASLSSSLDLFLRARTQALSVLLGTAPQPSSRPSTSTAAATKPHDAKAVQARIERVLACVLKTVEAVDAIFGPDQALLPRLLRELEQPSSTRPVPSSSPENPSSTELEPVLTTLPNYPTLSRHLPTSILSHNPFLASSSSTSLTRAAIDSALSAWFETSTTALLAGFDQWITSLPPRENTALTLSHVRDTIQAVLSSAATSAHGQATRLSADLDRLVESRLEQVYRAKLSDMVDELEPLLSALVDKLVSPGPAGQYERDPAGFFFELDPALPPAPPPPSSSLASGLGSAVAAKHRLSASDVAHPSGAHPYAVVDPLGSFLTRVNRRVSGRSPLVDEGVEQLEKRAKEVRFDLRSWLGSEEGGQRGTAKRRDADATAKETRLREQYAERVGETLAEMCQAMERVLERVETKSEKPISSALFIGTFARSLSLSRPFIRDLFLGVPPTSRAILDEWQAVLARLQERSIRLWQEDAVSRSSELLRRGTDKSVATRDYSAHREPVPSGPSKYLSRSISSLVDAVNSLPLHRIHSSPAPAKRVLDAYSTESLALANEFVGALASMPGGVEIKRQLVFDLDLIRTLVDRQGETEWPEVVDRAFDRLVLSTGSDAPTRSDITDAVQTYVLRTQSILAPLLPDPSSFPSLRFSTELVPKVPMSARLLLPLGPPPALPTASSGQFKSLVRTVKPGPRLGLLPTKVSI
ncbi:hypothetical protein JCM10212_006077 [Sporobolomyces blumeae]